MIKLAIAILLVLVAQEAVVDAESDGEGPSLFSRLRNRLRGGGPGGGGGHGRGRGRGPRRFFGNATRVENDCPIDDANPCPTGRNGEVGAWVCRTFEDPATAETESYSMCAGPQYKLDTDDCGCCVETGCPEPYPCTCACDTDEGVGLGRLITIDPMFREGEPEEKCVSEERANSAVARNPKASCAVC